jgi:integrase
VATGIINEGDGLMPIAKLSKRTVDVLKATDKPFIVYDTTIKGFGLRVLPSGAKSWVIEYRPGCGGRDVGKRRFKFGNVGDLTPDEARRAARTLLSNVRLGGDPAHDRWAARRQMTVAALAEEFIEEHAKAKRKTSTAGNYAQVLRRIVVPEIGSRKVDDVTRITIARLHLKMKTTPYHANKMLAVVGSMYSFAASKHIVPEGFNPVRGITRFPESNRDRFLTVSELERLGAALREGETTGLPWHVDPLKPGAKHAPKEDKQLTKVSPQAAAAIRLLLFTGCRLGEILRLQWADVDLERGLLFLRDSKTGRKTIVLNAPAAAILAELPRIGVYVIAGGNAGNEDEKPRSDLMRPWTAVRKRAGLEGVRLHDLRHTHASFGAAGGLGLPIIGKLLGHKQATTTARYAHLDNDPLRRASEQIGVRLAAALGEPPERRRTRGVVVSLRHRD